MPELVNVVHRLPQAEECQDGEHDYNGSDDPDDVVHETSMVARAAGSSAVQRENHGIPQKTPPARRQRECFQAAVAASTWLSNG